MRIKIEISKDESDNEVPDVNEEEEEEENWG